ncbi:MAG: TRAP transporter small permease [Spirochaetales bacterium]|nr:TRAP transporter small permease [Spirochaetales bacterium]
MVKMFICNATPFLRRTVKGMGFVSGAAILVMIIVPVTDILLRLFRLSITGSYDIVRMAGILALSAGLPYVTAVKGHVAIELIYHRLPKTAKVIVGIIVNMASMAFFGIICYQGVLYGLSLYQSGEVSATLQFPVFWIPFVLSFCSVIVVLVILYLTAHPGKELMKP